MLSNIRFRTAKIARFRGLIGDKGWLDAWSNSWVNRLVGWLRSRVGFRAPWKRVLVIGFSMLLGVIIVFI